MGGGVGLVTASQTQAHRPSANVLFLLCPRIVTTFLAPTDLVSTFPFSLPPPPNSKNRTAHNFPKSYYTLANS